MPPYKLFSFRAAVACNLLGLQNLKMLQPYATLVVQQAHQRSHLCCLNYGYQPLELMFYPLNDLPFVSLERELS